MSIADINAYGWIFLISLAVFAIGAFGWYINRSMIDLVSRLDRSGETPKFSYLQQWLLPKYKAGFGRFANEEFHDHVDKRSRNGIARISLFLLLLGAVTQLAFWMYLFNFANGEVSFLGPIA